MKDKYSTDGENSDNDSSSSEEPVVWSVEHEKDFLRTLSALKTHDPKIYSAQTFFTAKMEGPTNNFNDKSEKRRSTPMYLKDYERIIVLEKNGDISEEEVQTSVQPGFYEQQKSLKQKLKAALDDVLDDDDDDKEPLLKPRVKTEVEMKKEEDEYYEWLKGQKNEELPGVEEMRGLKEIWNDTNLEDNEKFLRDYILNKEYDVDDESGIPSYEEIVSVVKDEEELERGNEFERKYNFRYEEPDPEFIKQYPRTVKQSLRKRDIRRKHKRDAYKERKKSEKQTRKDEIKELKALKRKEIEEKLQRLKKLADDDDLPVNVDDLEADFDPTTYDKRMKEIFASQYYEKPIENPNEKPFFSDVSDDSDQSDYDNFDVNEERMRSEMELESEDHNDQERVDRKKQPSRRKKKRNSRFITAVLKKKPLFNPEEKTFEEYFNEYYALDYEDIIADGLITKFKYRNVPANDFGITIDELLDADDRQLNAWASLKKATAYRSDAEELYDIKAYKRKALNVEKKRRIFNTDFGGKKSEKLGHGGKGNKMEQNKSNEQTDVVPGRKGKRLVKRGGFFENARPTKQLMKCTKIVKNETTADKTCKTAQRRRKCCGSSRHFDSAVDIADDRLRAYSINPKKFKNKIFYKKQNRAG